MRAKSGVYESLKRAYRGRRLVLVLGAGVSAGSNLPNWERLIRRLFTANDERRTDRTLFQKLSKERFPLQVMASIAEERVANRDDFVERVRMALYKRFPFQVRALVDPRAIVEHVHARNSTLRAVAALCTRFSGSAKRAYRPNSRVRAIITFNLDHLLQIYTKARYRTHLLRTIERASASRSHSGRLPIYHMHGMLRFDEGAGDPSRESPDSVVLTEQDYFDFFDSPNRLFNYTFLYFLREFRCLFVGLSMQDANMRRLLHYSKRERMHGYRQEGAVDRLRRRTRHFAILPSMVDPAVDGAAEMGLEPLGVDCLWIEDFNEIPEVLGDLYAAGGHDWGPVWNEPARLVQP